MVSALGQQTIKRVTERLEAGESAGLSEIVELVQKLSGAAYDTSVQELAQLIGKDLVVTARVIAAANTLGYNPAGFHVATITEAIQVIGYNKIRQLAVSLLLMESADRTLNAAERREIAALALCSGLMAETVMGKRRTVLAEHAFICASLRNYGRLLMTSFMIEDYRRARILAATGTTEDEAYESVFGLTPLELGHHLLSSAHLPEAILKSLRAMPAGVIKTALHQRDMELLALSDLSVRVCELALRPEVTAADFAHATQLLAARSGDLFDLDPSSILAVLRQTGQQLYEFAHTFGLTALSDQFAPRLRARADGEEIGSDSASAARAHARQRATLRGDAGSSNGSKPAPAAQAVDAAASLSFTELDRALSTPAGEGSALPAMATIPNQPAPAATFQDIFQAGIDHLATLLGETPVDMRKVYGVVLRAALQGFETDQAVILIRDTAGPRYVASHGGGSVFTSIKNRPTGREEDRDVFGLCLQRLEDVLIYDAQDVKIQPHLPAWLRATPLASFVLLPIHDNRRPFAVLLAGWTTRRTAGFTVAQIRHVRSMLKLAGTARRLAQSR